MAACRHLSAWKAGRGGGGCASGGGDDAGGTAFLPVARALAELWGRAGEGKVREGKKGGEGARDWSRSTGGRAARARVPRRRAWVPSSHPGRVGACAGVPWEGTPPVSPPSKPAPTTAKGGAVFFGRADAPFFFSAPPLPLQPPRPPTPDPLFACLTCAAAADSRADMEAACGDPGTGRRDGRGERERG